MNIILFESEKLPVLLPMGDDRAQHIVKILKLKEGDSFKCGLVNGPSGICSIKGINAEGIVLSWEKKAEKKELYPLTLVVGYTRPISAKRILRETVSLGVAKLVFTGTDTGEKSYRSSNLWKTWEYKRYLIDGAQQAGQTAVPPVLFYPDIKHTLQAVTAGSCSDLLLLDNVSPAGSLSAYNPGMSGGTGPVVLAIGSERGWSDRERLLFSGYGFTAMKLGERILRTETACSAGTAVLLSRLGYV